MFPLVLLALAAFAATRYRASGGIGDHVFVKGDGILLGDSVVWPNPGEQTKGRKPSPYALGTLFTVDPDKIALTVENRAFVKTMVVELIGYRYAISLGMYRYRVRLTINGQISPCEAGYSELILARGINTGAFKPVKVV